MKKGIITIVIFIVIFLGLSRLVVPKYDGRSSPIEGGMVSAYYDETINHDVIFLGDCEVYGYYNPVYLYEKYGITSYIRGTPDQLVWQSYYMLEDTLRRETPKVVVFNVLALTTSEPQREEYNRMTIDGMLWSTSKLGAIKASSFSEENVIEYIFPILRYHSRITELTEDDLSFYFRDPDLTVSGYYPRVDVLPMSESDVADDTWVYEGDNGEDEIVDPWADIDTGEEESINIEKGTEEISDLSWTYLDGVRFGRLLCALCGGTALAGKGWDSESHSGKISGR